MTMVPTREQVPRLAVPVRRPGHPAAPIAGMNVRDMLRIVRKRKWLILLTFFICVAVSFLFTLLWWLYYPWYTAYAYVRVGPPQLTIMQAENVITPREVIERNKRTWASLVKDYEVLKAVAQDSRVTSKTWYEEHRNDIFKALDKDIDVSQMPDTDFLKLSMTGIRRGELADIVNAVADAFIKYAGEYTRRNREDQSRKLTGERTNLQNKLTSIRIEIARLRGQSPMAAMERRSTVAIRQQLLTEQFTQAEMEQAQADAAWKEYEKERDGGALANNVQVLEALNLDPALRALNMQVLEVQVRLDNARLRLLENHQAVVSTNALLTSLKAQVQTKHDEIVAAQVESIGQLRQMAQAITTERLADLRRRLNDLGKEARDVEESMGRIEGLSEEAKAVEEQLRWVERRVTEVQMVGRRGGPGEEVGEVGPVTPGAYATTPREIAWPKWKVMMPLGVLLGLVLGLGLAILLEMADTSVKNPADITRRVDVPLLGMVPHSDDLEEDIEDFRRVTLLAPHSLASEAFRQVRTNLMFSGPAQERRSLLVTSPAPGDGRTTVVMNLAASMAQAGRRVLVVDANFRQPAIAGLFPQAAAAGLSSALVGQAAWRDVVSPTGVPNLDVITAGPLPPNPAELLGSDTMRQLVAEMTADYDQVLFDGSPVMVVSDAAVLSTQVDGVVLVIRAGHNSVGIVQRTVEQLHRVGAHVLGVVLQGVRTTAGGYLRKNYETFYEYQQRPEP